MITLSFDMATQVARVTTTVVKVGADVPVRLTFSAAPGEVSSIQLALGSAVDAPETLAFTEDFAQESATVWTATLDATDTRLVEFMEGKGATVVNAELVIVLDGLRIVCPNVNVTVQPAIISTDPTSEGGPTYYTQAQIDAAIEETEAYADDAIAAAVGIGATYRDASADSDATRGAALIAAVAAAPSGSTIVVGGGTFALGNAVLALPNGVSLRGSGIGVTRITSTANLLTLGPAVQCQGSTSSVRQMTIEVSNGGVNTRYTACVGLYQGVGLQFTAVRYEDLELIGDTDCMYGGGAITARRIRFQSRWDGLFLPSEYAANVVIEDFSLTSTGDSPNTEFGDSGSQLGFGCTSGNELTLRNGSIRSRTSVTGRNATAVKNGGSCTIENVVISALATDGGVQLDLDNDGTMTVNGGRGSMADRTYNVGGGTPPTYTDITPP
jgi:hypothetical protein